MPSRLPAVRASGAHRSRRVDDAIGEERRRRGVPVDMHAAGERPTHARPAIGRDVGPDQAATLGPTPAAVLTYGIVGDTVDYPGAADLPYLRSSFAPLDDLARAHGHDPADVRRAIADRLLPAVAYVLEDGTELVAPDYFALADLAGSFEELPAWFGGAWERAATRYPAAGSAAEQWEEYLTGIYAVCLRSVTPASIVAKGELMDTIERLTADPAPEDDGWRSELKAAVDALDALEKPFAAFDRERFGPVSRDRCVTDVRERFALDRPGVSIAA